MLNKIEQIIKYCISRKAISLLLPAFTLVIFFIGFIFIAIQSVNAAPGIRQTINFQGKLVDDNGLNVADSSYSVVFTLYDASSGGTQLWQETRSVTTSDGIFREELGTSTSLSSVDFNDDSIYLGIKVGADAEMTPRVRFTATPYAFQARSVAWSGLQDAAANLAVSMGAYTSTFTYGNSTGANDLFNLTDTASNTGTGRLLSVQSASGSTVKPFHVSAGGAEAILVDANGNIGIGTTNPTRKLDVNGTLRVRGQVYDYNNEVGTPGQVLSTTASGVDWIDASGVGTDNQTLANVYSQAGNDVQLAGAYGDIRFYRGTSTEMLFLDESSGNIGIGTTNPTYKLSVNGTVEIVNGSDLYSFGSATLGNRTYTAPSYVASGQTFTASIQALDDAVEGVASGVGGVWTRNSGSGYLFPGTLSDSVGIGTSTPTAKLQVVGNIVGSTLSDGTISITGGTIAGASSIAVADGSASAPSYTFSNDGNTGLYRPATDSIGVGTSGVERIRVSPNGNVGIGTTNPTYKLSVNGSLEIANGSELYSFGSATLGNRSYTTPTYVASGQTFTASIQALDDAVEGVVSGSGGVWSRDSGSGYLFPQTITDSVGIGISTPTEKLHVVGNILATGNIVGSTLSDGTISITGGNITGAGNITAGGIITGTGSGLTGLNASNLASGTVPSARIAGDYLGITGVGTITSGTWQGSVISSTYLDPAVILATEIDTSSEIAAIVGDETGSGALVFANTPTFAGDVYFPGSGVWNSSGNVGIGTTDPGSYKLNVAGTGYFGSTITIGGSSDITSYGSTTLGNRTYTTPTYVASGQTFTASIQALDNAVEGVVSGSGGVWSRDSGSGYLFPQTLTDSVGIGTSVPSEKLHVIGNAIISGNITSGGIITGTGSGLTGLNASNLASGTVASARIAGNYSGITGVGTITSGTWQGSVISNTYLDSLVILSTEIDTSSELAAIIGDETGSGALVFANSPALVTPNIGAATGTSLNVTGAITSGGIITGTGSGLTALNASNLTTGTVPNGRIAGAYTNFTDATGSGTAQFGTFSAGDGTRSAPAYTFSSDTNTGMYRIGNDILSFATAGADRFTILAGGNVGIGTTNPTYKLSVNGSLEIVNGSELYSFGSATLGNRSYTTPTYVASGQTFTASIQALDNAVESVVSGSGGVWSRDSGSGYLFPQTITDSVGIGTSTPTAKLQVVGNIVGSTLSDGTISITGGNITGAGNITAGGIITGTGSGLTGLNASNLASGTVPSARISGNYSGITGVGTITSGTWQGSVISNTYLDPLVILSTEIDTYTELNAIVADVTLTHNGLIDTSAEIAAIVGDETGSGALVFANSPALVTPNIGAATGTSLNVTGAITAGGIITGTGSGLTALNASNLTTGTVPNGRIAGAYTNFTNVTGSGTAQFGTFSADNGSRTAPAYTFTSDTNTGMYRIGTDILSLATAGADQLTILASGNVGIGTTNPGAKLEVNGQVKITGGSPGANKVLTSDSSGLATWQTLGATSIADDSLDFDKFKDVMLLDANTSVDQNGYNFSFFNTGNIGIGTSAPTAKLQVVGNIVGSTLSDGTLSITAGNITGAGNITSGGIITGTGSGLTGLNASNLASGTVPSARISGNYSGITGVGTITSGTWQGSVISNTYLDPLVILSTEIDTYTELNSIVADVTLTHNGLIDTSAEIAAIVGDETGSGALVFANSPALVTPNIGAATGTSLNVTGAITAGGIITGTGSGLTGLNASNLASGTVPDARITGAYTGFTNITGSGTVQFGTFSADNGSRTAPAYTFTSDTNTGMYRIGTDILSLATAGADRFTILAGGNVGIGTTNPGAKLEVNGQVKITGGSPGTNKVLTSDSSGLATWQTLGAASIGDDSLDFDKFIDNMTLDAKTTINQAGFDFGFQGTGSVGIGTTIPASKLHVDDDTDVTTSSGGSFIVGSSTGSSVRMDGNEIAAFTSGNQTGAILYLQNDTGTVNIGGGTLTVVNGGTSTVANAFAVNGNSTLGNANTDTSTLRGLITLSDSASSYPLRFGADVDLYRGTTNRLDLATGDSFNIVSGDLQVAGNTAIDSSRNANFATSVTLGADVVASRGAANRLDLASGDSLNLVSGDVQVGGTSVITSGRLVQTANGSRTAPAYSFSADTNTGMYRIGTDILSLATAGADRFTILANGSVGIGRTNPTFKLDVAGGTRVSALNIGSRYYSDNIYSYTNGILIATDIATSDNRMIELVVEGNSYSASGPIETKIQAYNYVSGGNIIQTSGIAEGPSSDVDIFHYGGYVYFWLQQSSSFQTMRFQLRTNTGNHTITSITNAAKPVSGVTNSVTITPMKAWYAGNDGSGSGLDADLFDSLNSDQFLRSDASDNYTSGTLAFNGGTTLDVNGNLSIADTSIAFDGASTNFATTGNFSINTSQFFLNQSTGDVGIDNGSPGTLLQIGNYLRTSASDFSLLTEANYDSSIKLTEESANYGFTLQYNGSSTNDLYVVRHENDATGQIMMAFDRSTGYVGIGTTTPSTALEVAGQIKITGGSPGTNKVLVSDSTGLASWTTLGEASITDDSLDFNKFRDNMTLDATTTIDLAGYNLGIHGTGNVGIGTSNPSQKLEVAGNALFTTNIYVGTTDVQLSRGAANRLDLASGDSLNLVSGNLQVGGTTVVTSGRLVQAANGSRTTPSYSFSADTNTGMYRIGTDILSLATAGNDGLTILANGSVGIGTTSPGAALHVRSTNTTFKVNNSSSEYVGLAYYEAGNDLYLGASSSQAGNLYVKNAAGAVTVGINSDAASYFTGGSVGIGTSVPGDALDVSGVIDTTGGYEVDDNTVIDNAGRYFYTQNTSVNKFGAANASGFGIDALNSGDWDLLIYEGQTYTENLKLGYGGSTSILSSYDTNESLTIRANGSGAINIMDSGTGDVNIDNNTLYVDNSANWVGIGTTSPNASLHVFGSNSSFKVNNSASEYVGLAYYEGGNDLYLGASSSQAGNLYIKNSTGALKAAINSDAASYFTGGNVGIGTSVPGDLLHLGTTGGIRLTNSELANVTDTTGVLYFDENYYSSGEAGYPYLNGNGGGLAIKNEDGWGAVVSTANMQYLWMNLDRLHIGGTSDPGTNNLLVDGTITSTGTITAGGNVVPTLKTNNATVTDGWYRIASDGPTADGAAGGDTAYGRFVVWTYESGRHCQVDFTAGYDYSRSATSPTVILNSNNCYNGTDTPITAVRAVAGDTYEGGAVEVYIDVTTSASVGYQIYNEADETPDTNSNGAWTPVDWTAGSIWTGAQATTVNISSTDAIMGAASGSGETDEFYLTRDGAGVFSNAILNKSANGELGASTNFVFRDTGDSWLRLRTASGGSTYADLAVGNLNVAGNITAVQTLSFSNGANHSISSNASGLIFDGGDGTADFLVYDDSIYSDTLRLGYSGAATLTTYDTNENLIIDPNGTGLVAVGNGFTPTADLHIGGGTTTSDGTPDIPGVQISGGNSWAKLELAGGAASTGGHIDFIQYGDLGTDYSGRIIQRTDGLRFGTSSEDNLTIADATGYVGIGGLASYPLDVTGNARMRNNLYIGTSGNYLTSQPSGDYGSIQVNAGGKGNWEGYSIDGRAVFMHDGGTSTGLFNDVDNEWLVYAVHNNSVNLYYNGSAKLATTSTGAAVTGDFGVSGNFYDSTDGIVNISDSLQTAGNLIVAANGYLEDDTTMGGNSDDWIKFSGYIEMKSNTNNYGIVLRDSASTNYMGLTQVGGVSYLADSNIYSSYFLSGNGANGTFRGNMYVGGGTSYYFNSSGLVNASHLRATTYVQVGSTNDRGLYYYDGDNDLYIGGVNTQDGNIFVKDRGGTQRIELNTDNIRGILKLYGGPTHGWTHFGGNYADDQWLRVTTDGGSAYRSFAVGSFYSSTSFGAYGNHICSSSVGSGTYGSCSSSLRYKDNVEDNIAGLSDVMKMRPKKFNWKYNGQSDIGFIAEELEQINTDFVFYNDEGKVEGVRYDGLTGVLVNAIQEQQAQIASMSAGLNTSGELALSAVDADYSVKNIENNTVLSNTLGAYSVISAYLNAGKIDTYDLSVTGKAKFSNINVGDFSIGAKTLSQYIEDTVTTGQIFTTLDDQVTTQETQIQQLDLESNILSTSVASQSATLSTVTARLDQMEQATNDTAAVITSLQDRIASLETMFANNMSTSSAMLFTDSPSATVSAGIARSISDTEVIFDKKLIAEDDVTILGNLNTSDIGVTGTISSGLLTINGFNDEMATPSATITTLGGILSLQHDGMSGIDFVAGKVAIDVNGNVLVREGDVEIENGDLVLRKGSIKGSTSIRGIDVAVTPGATELDVTFTDINDTDTYAISVLPTWFTNVIVQEKTIGGFKILFDRPAPADAKIDWMIVE